MNEHDKDDIRSMLDADRIIHEPARLIITAILFTAESADFTYLMRETGLTRGNLSSHLSKLQEAGYVEVEKTFAGKLPRTVCRLTATGREVFVDYRARLRQTMNSLLAPPEPPRPQAESQDGRGWLPKMTEEERDALAAVPFAMTPEEVTRWLKNRREGRR